MSEKGAIDAKSKCGCHLQQDCEVFLIWSRLEANLRIKFHRTDFWAWLNKLSKVLSKYIQIRIGMKNLNHQKISSLVESHAQFSYIN